MKRKWNVNDDFFDNIDSEEKAYLLGFFLADGTFGLGTRCTKSYRFSICIQEDDVEILKYYHTYLTNSPIFIRNYQNKWAIKRKPVASIRWTSKYMGDNLINKYHITPRKTYDKNFKMDFSLIPEELHFDFIRGYFDGDGAVSHKENTWELQFAIYSTSESFLNQIADIYEKNFIVKRKITYRDNKTTRLYCLMFNAFGKKLLFHDNMFMKFYYNKKCYLKRKMLKFLGYLKFKYRDNPEYFERIQGIVERR